MGKKKDVEVNAAETTGKKKHRLRKLLLVAAGLGAVAGLSGAARKTAGKGADRETQGDDE
jgi:hypothetical protein